MATVTLRPTSGSGSSWSNTTNTYDGSTSTSGTVSITSSTYSSCALTLNFDTSSIPTGSTINSAILTVVAKQSSSSSSRRITVYADVNGDSSSRVISQQLTTTSSTTLTGDISSYMPSLSTLVITPYVTTSRSGTFTLYEVYIDVDYTENTSGGETTGKNILYINSNNDWGYVVETISGQTYTGTSITIEKNYDEDIDVIIYPNEGYVITNVYDDMFGDDSGSFTQYPYGILASSTSSSGTESTIVVTYEKIDSESEESPADKNRLIFTSNMDAGYVVLNGQNYTGTNIIVDLDLGEDIIVEVHANDGYIIDTVVEPIYGNTETVSGSSWIPAEIDGSLFNYKLPDLNYVITYKKSSGDDANNNLFPSFIENSWTIPDSFTVVTKNDYDITIIPTGSWIEVSFNIPEEWQGKTITFGCSEISEGASFVISTNETWMDLATLDSTTKEVVVTLPNESCRFHFQCTDDAYIMKNMSATGLYVTSNEIGNSDTSEESVSNISIGNITLNQVYIGEQEIQEIYLGDNLLFKK